MSEAEGSQGVVEGYLGTERPTISFMNTQWPQTNEELPTAHTEGKWC